MATRSICITAIGREKPFYKLTWRKILLWLFVLITTLSSVGCVNALDQDTDISERNEKIAAQVKVALAQEPALNAAPIAIKANDGVVTLGGFVEKESQRQRASKAASRVIGVLSVINDLQVK